MTTPSAPPAQSSRGVLTRGVLIERIAAGSAAARAGLQEGDLIVAIDGVTAADCLDVDFHAAQEIFEVTARRGDEIVVVEIERDYGEAHGMILEDPPIRQCTNFCPFCFVDQAPQGAKFRKGLEIKDDDYRYSFLYGHYVTLTNLSNADFERIRAMRLSPLYISVHATDPAVRAQLLGRPKVDVMPVLRRLASASIELHTQIVMIRGLNDGDVMTRTVADLFELRPAVQSVAVVPVGLTSHHRQGVRRWTRSEAADALESILEFGRGYPAGFVQAADEWFSILGENPPAAEYYGGMAVEENGVGMVRRMLDDWAELAPSLAPHPALSSLIVTGASPERWLREIVGDFNARTGSSLELRAAVNATYGPDTTVTGLLGWRDIAPVIAASERRDVVIPDVMLRGGDRFLDDITLEEARVESGRTIRAVETSARGFATLEAR